MPSKDMEYHHLCEMANKCRECPGVFHRYTYLNWNNGSIKSPIVFIGEAPGFVKNPANRLKAFHGNQSGWNFEYLLSTINVSRNSVFVTNALLHTPVIESGRKYDDDYGNLSIRPPSEDEIKKCGRFLEAQLELIKPKIICTIGRAAITACQTIFPDFPHIILKVDVATPMNWKDKIVFPLFHTSPNVTASIRSLKQMEKDFKTLGALMDNMGIRI